MTVKLDVSGLTRLAARERKAAARVEEGVGNVVATNAMLLARIAKVEAPLSDGSRGADEHLRDTIGWVMAAEAGGRALAVIGPEGEYGERIGSLVEFGTRAHKIRPRLDGPGYLAWPTRARIDPNPKQWGDSVEYSGDASGELHEVNHPGTEPDPFMMRALLAVRPKFVKDIEALGDKAI